jgi:hypothetical protein
LKQVTRQSKERWLTGALLITLLNFGAVYFHRIPSLSRSDLLTAPQTAQFISQRESGQPSPFRVFSVFGETAIWDESTKCQWPDLGNWDISRPDFFLRQALLEPNLNIYYGLDSADGYEPYEPVRMGSVVGYLGSRQSVTKTPTLAIGDLPLSAKITRVYERLNLYRQLNIKYLLSYYPLEHQDLSLATTSPIGACGSHIYVYEVSSPWPRYFLTDRVGSLGSSLDFVDQMKTLAANRQPTVMLEALENVPPSRGSFVTELVPAGSSDHLLFTVNNPTDHPSYLFVGQAMIPGWRAYLDQQAAPLLTANYAYLAIVVPPGRHLIQLDYSWSNLQKSLFQR